MAETTLKKFLLKLNKNYQILKEREAKYASVAPLDLLNQIDDYDNAIKLTEQAIEQDIPLAELQDQFGGLNLEMQAVVFISNLPAEDMISECPYRGLYHFRPDDAHYFFGREIFITRLVRAVHKRNFIAVIGASGSGKSSVVLAGLAPMLELQQPGRWKFSHFRPGADPFFTLAAGLIPLYPPEAGQTPRQLADDLRTQSRSLAEVMVDIQAAQAGSRILLIADQFEELYTLCPDVALCRDFLDTLLIGIQTPPPAAAEPSFSLMLTMRADFLGEALTHRLFEEALRETIVTLGPMKRNELAQAVEKPAQAVGLTFEEGLVERILDDVAGEPGNLPLLEFALTLLWERRSGDKLTHEGYESIGKVEGALAQYADQEYQDLSRAQQEQARRIFVQLVHPGQGVVDTRRQATQKELGGKNWILVRQLADARLVVTGRSEAEEETAEVVHEALINSWGRLRTWMNEDRTFRAWQDQLRLALVQWETATENQSEFLLHGGPLAEAEEWLGKREADLTAAEQEFIRASITLREKEQAEKESQRRRIFTALGAIALLIIVFLSFALWSSQRDAQRQQDAAETAQLLRNAEADALATAQVRGTAVAEQVTAVAKQAASAKAAQATAEANEAEAKRQANIALSRQLANQSANELDKPNYELAFLLAIEAGRVANTSEAFKTLRQAFEHRGRTIAILPDSASEAKWNGNGNRILTINRDTVRVWDIEHRVKLIAFFEPSGIVEKAEWNGDGTRILTISGSIVQVWNAETGEELITLAGHTDLVEDAVWNIDESRILTIGNWRDSTIRVWEADTGDELVILSFADRVNHVEWNADGSRILIVTVNAVSLWDGGTGDEVASLPHTGLVPQAQWSADKGRILTSSTDDIVRVWDAEAGSELITLPHTEGVYSIQWSADGSRILTENSSIVSVWDAETGVELMTFDHTGHLLHEGISHVQWSTDGSRILTRSDRTGTVTVWDAETGTKLFTHSGWIYQAEWNTEKSRILARSDRIYEAWVWDAETGDELITLPHTERVYKAEWSTDEDRPGRGSSYLPPPPQSRT